MAGIRFEDVSKRFLIHYERPRSFQDLVVNLFQRGNREELWALRNLSFEAQPGETLGLIGPNGSGKSTALKLMSRIFEPTSGRVAVEGRLSALIELGAGFHPDLTGRENIFLNGSLLGLSRAEMRDRYDDVVDFAELGRFIDMPLKHYSSGMQMRLGFAIATCVDPDVLLVDEVLAVGDEGFQRKCLARINRLRGQQRVIVYVSHDLGSVRQLCDRVIWLENGLVQAEGPAQEVVTQYLVRVGELEESAMAGADTDHAAAPDEPRRWGSGEVRVDAVELRTRGDPTRHVLDPEDSVTIDICYHAAEAVDDAVLEIGIFRDDGTHCYGTNTSVDGHRLDLAPGPGRARVVIDRLGLLPGTYSLDVAVHSSQGHPYDYQRQVCTFSVRSLLEDSGIYRPEHRWELDGVEAPDPATSPASEVDYAVRG
jgi:lipopolysaccharide transport system ATP-binding protein